MKKIIEELTKNVINFTYEVVDEDITYAEEAERILSIMDAIRDIENVTELVEVCDDMRSDVMDLMRGDNVEAAFAIQRILHMLKDLATCHEILSCFTRTTLDWRRGITTCAETLKKYTEAVYNELHVTKTFAVVRDYSYTEIWDMFH